jgi:zinc protease
MPAPATASSVVGCEAVRSLVLTNGMKVIVWPDRSIPNIALYNWVRAGSRNEVVGSTGLAHFFEHMMFNGTARFGPGEFDRLMEAQGGSNNAFTSDDVTVYQDWFPRGALDLVFDLEADRIANLNFDPKLIESERRVVSSERRLHVDDNNAGLLAERVQAAAFVAHPYRFPTIGRPEDIKAWKIEDLQRFFRTYYAPNNQTLVLAGDVTAEEAFALARKYLARVPRRPAPPPVRVREPRQFAERRVTLRRKGQTPLLHYAYKAPAARDPLAPAVNLLIAALVDGEGSRLHRLLVERHKLVAEVSGDWHEGFDPSLCWLYLTLPEGADPRAVAAVLDAELTRVAAEGISEAELARAKSLRVAAFWKQLATIDGKAQLLGEYELLHGGWRELWAAPLRYEGVTRGDVHAAARAILKPSARTVGVLRPTRPERR